MNGQVGVAWRFGIRPQIQHRRAARIRPILAIRRIGPLLNSTRDDGALSTHVTPIATLTFQQTPGPDAF